MNTTTVKVGKQILLDVDIAGEPAPEVKWFLLGKEVTDTDLLQIRV